MNTVDHFLTVIESDGAAACLRSNQIDWVAFDAQLKDLAAKGFGPAVAEWILGRVLIVFQRSVLAQFHRAIPAQPQAALDALVRGFVEFASVLKRVGERLQAPDLASVLAANLRVAVLGSPFDEPGTAAGAARLATRAAFLAHARARGRRLIELLADGNTAAARSEAIVVQQQQLTLGSAPEVKALWREMLDEEIRSRVDALDSDFTVPQLAALLAWKDSVADAFVRVVLGSEDRDLLMYPERRAEIDLWSHASEQLLLDAFGALRCASLFDIVVDYPESVPALQDLQTCLHRSRTSTLHDALVATAKSALASKLHHAGAATESVLTVIVNVVRSFCVLYSKNEAGAVVAAVVQDTLDHLRRRRDSVTAVVRAVTHPSPNVQLFSEFRSSLQDEDDSDAAAPVVVAAGSGSAGGGQRSPSGAAGAPRGSHGGGQQQQQYYWRHQRRPDVLRVLLSSLSLTAIAAEYRGSLCAELLDKAGYDCDAESEVLERMKSIFGEEPLTQCVVMIRDVAQSRRINAHVVVEGPSRGAGKQLPFPMSATVISATCWPVIEQQEKGFVPHPALAGAADEYALRFNKLRPNQVLKWLPNVGKVTVTLTQSSDGAGDRPPGAVTTDYELSPLVASVALYLHDAVGGAPETPGVPSSAVRVASLAACLKVTPAVLLNHCRPHVPTVFELSAGDTTIALQRRCVSSSAFSFEETRQVDDAPAGISKTDLEMYANMIGAMTKTGGAKSVQQIENSMRMFAKFQGTTADLIAILTYMQGKGKLVTADGVRFSAPKPPAASTTVTAASGGAPSATGAPAAR